MKISCCQVSSVVGPVTSFGCIRYEAYNGTIFHFIGTYLNGNLSEIFSKIVPACIFSQLYFTKLSKAIYTAILHRNAQHK